VLIEYGWSATLPLPDYGRVAPHPPRTQIRGNFLTQAIARARPSHNCYVAYVEELFLLAAAIATSRTLLWPASGQECRGRRLSRERGNLDMPPWLWWCRPAWHKLDPVGDEPVRRWDPRHYPGVIQNFLKLPGGLSALGARPNTPGHAHRWIKGPEETRLSAARLAQFIGNGNLEKFDRLGGIAMIQRKKRTYGWQVIELN